MDVVFGTVLGVNKLLYIIISKSTLNRKSTKTGAELHNFVFEFAANNSLSVSTSFVSLFVSFHSYARLNVAR